MKHSLLIAAWAILAIPMTTAQETWNLQRCVDEALKNSLLIRQARLGKDEVVIAGKQLRSQRIPSLNASSNLGVTFGRVINPATSAFETANSYYQGMNLQAGVMLFDGMRLTQSIRQNKFQYDAADADVRQTENDIALSVALAYLNVLLAYENLEIADARLQLTQDQLANTDKLIAAGSRPENDRFDILAQLAIDEQSRIQAQNNIDINLLTLKQQMMLDAGFPLVIDRPTIDVESLEALENQTLDAIYTAALSSQPQSHAAELREQASEAGIAIARSQLYPSLSLGGSLGSNWSDLAREPTDFMLRRVQQPGVFINDEPASFEIESLIPTSFRPIPYGDQLDNNIGYGIGATLSIPIFNQYANRAGIERAKITAMRAEVTTTQAKQTLRTDIQNALTSARAGRKSLDAAQAARTAATQALRDAERRFELGSLGNFEYLSARNRADTAEMNLLIARYDYYFRIKVLDFYMGRVILLN